MIVQGMNHEETIRELEKDYQEVMNWAGHPKINLRRLALKHKGEFPHCFPRVYTSKHGIEWTVLHVLFGKHLYGNLIYAVVRNTVGLTVYHPSLFKDPIVWAYYTSHFFDRYEERFRTVYYEDDMSRRELIQEYFLYNSLGVFIDGKVEEGSPFRKPSGRFKQRENSDRPMMYVNGDGVALGQCISDVFYVMATYISFDMLMKDQEYLVLLFKRLVEIGEAMRMDSRGHQNLELANRLAKDANLELALYELTERFETMEALEAD